MFERWYLLIFSIFSRGASRCSHVAKLAYGLKDRDKKISFFYLQNLEFYSILINFFVHSSI